MDTIVSHIQPMATLRVDYNYWLLYKPIASNMYYQVDGGNDI